MTKNPEAPRPIGRIRWVTGLILIVLGATVSGRAIWLVTHYGSGFGDEEWVPRFWFWLWVGTLFILTGIWLAYRSRVASWAAGLALLVFVAVVLVHDYWLR